MKWLFSLIWWVVLAVCVAWLLNNSAMVSVFVDGLRIDLSLNLILTCLALGVWLLLVGLRFRYGIQATYVTSKRARLTYKEQAVSSLVLDALSLQLAGRHGRAQTAAAEAIEKLDGLTAQDGAQLPRQATLRVLANWVCAESAHTLRQTAVVDTHLAHALALELGDSPRAHQRLAELPKAVSRRVQVWRARLDLALMDQQPEKALEAVRTLTKHGVYAARASLSLQRSLAVQMLERCHDEVALESMWKSLPQAERAGYDVSLAWVSQRLAVAADLSDEVAVKLMSQLQVIWDNIGDLSDAQQARLVACMTQLLPQLPDSWLGVIEQAQQQQPEKGLLQYLTAVAYVQRQLVGKAKPMLKRAAESDAPLDLRRDAWVQTAKLEAELGDQAAAAAAWQAAALAS
jgi:HemY protein